ncbi:MAG: immunity 26/phosphotriesterase HocA family protein [Planctomycetaceae bacterium]|nr:immunity 26/phosphotriesterase HocA family protein [Planctomycetaceae bacterium]
MMKPSINIHQDILNNSQRPYFGLNPIDPKWDEVEIKPGYTVFFDGNVIKKVISLFPPPSMEWDKYREYDTELPTRDRQFVLPKTAKGKEKKLNYTSVNAVMPSGVEFHLEIGGLRPSLWVGNPRNAISLSLSEERIEPKTLEEFRQWRDVYIADSPPDHFEKVDRMRNLSHRTIKYFNGDIFRFEIGRDHYGFGIIIGQILKMQKDGIIPEERHALNHVMMVPLLVRFYQLKTKDREPAIETITSSPMLPAAIMSDGPVLWGSVDIVGNKQLQADDIDFLMHVGRTHSGKRDSFCFCWGIGMMVTKKTSDMPKLKDTRYPHGCDFFNNGVDCGVDTSIVLRAMRGEYPHQAWRDICHPDNSFHKEAVFQYLQLPLSISFDEFNSQHNGMTRQQYADYANKYLRVEKTSTPSKKGRSSSQKQ